MKKLIYILLLVSSCLYSQNSKFYNIDIKSPGITDFIKYGNMSSLSYTGALDFSIPLIEEASINLSYDSSGFRPAKRSGLVGLNWYLNMGGAITREVEGMPDDQIGEPHAVAGPGGDGGYVQPLHKYTNGFIVGIRNMIHNKDNVFNFSSSDGSLSVNYDYYLNGTDIYKNYEGDPDIFSFNFNGISGKFFMGNDGVIKVVSNQPNNLKIDITGMQNQPLVSTSKPLSSLIIITDNSGNKYHFGGHTKNLEYTANGKYPIITTWHLNKIEYYNGKITNFVFRDDSALQWNFDDPSFSNPAHAGFPPYNTNPLLSYPNDPSMPYLRDFCVLNEYVSDQRQIIETYTNQGAFLGHSGNSGYGGISMTTTLQKIAILDQINSDDFVVNFSYSKQPNYFNTYTSSSINSASRVSKFFLDINLTKIEFFAKNGNTQGGLIKTIDFGYTYLGGTYNRMFLTTLIETGKPAYQFEYNDTSNLPMPITFGVDHWGFWNGNLYNTNALVPFQNYQLNGDFTECTTTTNADCTSRDPNFNFTLKGMLNKVTYPTRGYTRFEYEQNDYSKRLEGRSVNNYIPALYDVSSVGGGLRIKKIVDSFDGLTETNEKLYEYKNDLDISSGVLLKWPRYILHWTTTEVPNDWVKYNFIRSNPIGRHILDAPIITYSQVTEKTTTNGKKVVKFTDYTSNPDDYSSNFYDHLLGGVASPINLGRNFVGLYLNDRSVERGKILWEKIYNANNSLVQQTNYKYNIDPTKTNNWSAKLHLSGPSIQSNKVYFYNDYLTEKTSTLYTSSGNLVTKENYTYISAPSYTSTISNQDLLSKLKTTSANNEIIETEYKYPWQNYLLTSTEFLNFKNANIMFPIREIQYRNAVKLSEKFTLFAKDASTNFLLQTKSIYSAKFPNSITNIANIGNLEKFFTYDLYDNKGNVLQYTQENGIPVAVVWGYNQTKPIAKIENALYINVQQYVSNLQALSNGTNEVGLISALNALRTNFPNAMITTITYKPSIGISTITDPKEDVITYHYDGFNRLEFVKDKNNNILSENKYHYKN
jgi:hypothetical protein